MVSLRCKMLVENELEKLEIGPALVELGMVTTVKNIPKEQKLLLKNNLLRGGLELLEDRKAILIERIINVVIEMVHYSDEMPELNYSDYISNKLQYQYSYLARIFSDNKGVTIQQFIINHKIERVKELLVNNEMNLTEISYKLNYSSVAHLSNQFKKVTGLSPSCYKHINNKSLSTLESV